MSTTHTMEPYIKLMNTDFDVENLKFTDKIEYGGYDFSVIVSSKDIEKICKDLDYLFSTPKITGILNVANLNEWHISFYDHTGEECKMTKLGEYIYISLPHYLSIATDVSSGIVYLRIFRDTCKHLLEEVNRNYLNTAQILSDC